MLYAALWEESVAVVQMKFSPEVRSNMPARLSGILAKLMIMVVLYTAK
jgi:hypothetical protein